jgi:hypothetical protein
MLKTRLSPALVVACLALFISLGGVSYGVATGFIDSREIKNNTIRTQDIRNSEVRGRDIRNSTIQGGDVAFNTLKGADIEESSLGKVPSAASADSASALSTLRTFPRTQVASGGSVTLVTQGPLTLTAACVDVAGVTTARIRVQTTEAGAAGTGVPTINPGDGPVTVAELADPAGGGRSAESRTVFAQGASGKALTAEFGLVVETGGMGTCAFNGHVVLEG